MFSDLKDKENSLRGTGIPLFSDRKDNRDFCASDSYDGINLDITKLLIYLLIKTCPKANRIFAKKARDGKSTRISIRCIK